jgi:hypothetical protein
MMTAEAYLAEKDTAAAKAAAMSASAAVMAAGGRCREKAMLERVDILIKEARRHV